MVKTKLSQILDNLSQIFNNHIISKYPVKLNFSLYYPMILAIFLCNIIQLCFLTYGSYFKAHIQLNANYDILQDVKLTNNSVLREGYYRLGLGVGFVCFLIILAFSIANIIINMIINRIVIPHQSVLFTKFLTSTFI